MTLGCLFHCGQKSPQLIVQKYLSTKNSCTDVKMKDLKYVTFHLLIYCNM